MNILGYHSRRQRSGRDLHCGKDRDRKVSVGGVAVAVNHVRGKVESPAAVGCAEDLPGRIQLQPRRQRTGIERPGEGVVTTRRVKRRVVINPNLAIRQIGGGDLNSAAKLSGEIKRAVVIGNVDVLIVRALIG